MRILNLNPASDIGASAWFVEIEGHRVLLDAGTHPKREGRESLPLYKLIAKEELDAIAVTHCHHDHVGSLPVALRHFPKAHVLMTELSYFLIERVLHNSVNVMTGQRDELGIKEYPLYSHDEVDEIAALFQGFRYSREVEWFFFQAEDGIRDLIVTGVQTCALPILRGRVKRIAQAQSHYHIGPALFALLAPL